MENREKISQNHSFESIELSGEKRWMVSPDGDYCPGCWDKYLSRLDPKIRKIAINDSQPLTKVLMQQRDDQLAQCSDCFLFIEGKELDK